MESNDDFVRILVVVRRPNNGSVDGRQWLFSGSSESSVGFVMRDRSGRNPIRVERLGF